MRLWYPEAAVAHVGRVCAKRADVDSWMVFRSDPEAPPVEPHFARLAKNTSQTPDLGCGQARTG